MNAIRGASALLLLLLAAGTTAAAVTQQTYQIFPGGSYQYKVGGRGPGIPGGMPSEHQLDFGIGGTFDYRLDTMAQTAQLLNLNLVLTGNEAIQAAPPGLHPVTADRVETYLASHTFVEDFIGGLLHLKSSTVPGLKLTDGLNGNIAITGGFDHTPVDGTGMLFNFSAVVVPEPAGAAFAAAAGACTTTLTTPCTVRRINASHPRAKCVLTARATPAHQRQQKLMQYFIGQAATATRSGRAPSIPPSLAEDMLGFYAQHFSTVEMNNTFYRMPTAEASRRSGRRRRTSLHPQGAQRSLIASGSRTSRMTWPRRRLA
jgi:hypothetical protein